MIPVRIGVRGSWPAALLSEGYGYIVNKMGIYYVFSHGLRDIHMTLLFLPGVSAALLFLFLSLFKIRVGASARYAFHFGYAGVWVYLLLKGIYTMAKTGSDWLYVFWVYAIVCFGIAIALCFLHKKGENQVQGA